MRNRPMSAELDRGRAVAATRGVRRWVSPGWPLAACSSMHVVDDALCAGLYPRLPLAAADLRLSYAEVGAITLCDTCTLPASALAWILYGLLTGRTGLGPTVATLAAVTASIAPLAWLVGRGLRTDLSR